MPAAKTASAFRKDMARLMKESVDDQAAHGNYDYVFARPQSVKVPITYKPGKKIELDCSDYCRFIAWNAKVPDDPAGTDYADYGNSNYIWLHLPHAASLEDVQVGDIFTFGYYAGERHACMAYNIKDKKNPIVANMGTDGQPVFRTLQQEIDGHRGMTVTLCKIKLPPDPPATPEDKLRAKTGFYAWFKWIQGEGEWKHYGPKNPEVRPDVPKNIGLRRPKWWARRVQFLARRKKGDKPTSKR